MGFFSKLLSKDNSKRTPLPTYSSTATGTDTHTDNAEYHDLNSAAHMTKHESYSPPHGYVNSFPSSPLSRSPSIDDLSAYISHNAIHTLQSHTDTDTDADTDIDTCDSDTDSTHSSMSGNVNRLYTTSTGKRTSQEVAERPEVYSYHHLLRAAESIGTSTAHPDNSISQSYSLPASPCSLSELPLPSSSLAATAAKSLSDSGWCDSPNVEICIDIRDCEE
jgi:hypothetical protein